jgi:hypothetical protein
MTTPKRIQRKRTKGWKMPDGAVYVGRPTIWGNPFVIRRPFTPVEIVAMYRAWMRGHYDSNTMPARPDARELRGKDLACWCPLDQPCHADVLLEIANAAVTAHA